MMPVRRVPKQLLPVPPLSALLESPRGQQVLEDLGLTKRQADVIRLVLQARKDKQIASELNIGIPTVRMHLRYAFALLGVCDRMALAAMLIPLLCHRAGTIDKNNTSKMS